MIDIATYVVSDIHGEYELFIRLLEEIHLKETDTLYVLGDILDKGPHPIQIILKLMEMPNVICLTGNHELMALECLEFLMQEITEISIEKVDEKMLENCITGSIDSNAIINFILGKCNSDCDWDNCYRDYSNYSNYSNSNAWRVGRRRYTKHIKWKCRK